MDAQPLCGGRTAVSLSSSAAGSSDHESPELVRARRVEGSEHFRSGRVHTPAPPSAPILFNRSIYCNLIMSPCLRSDATSRVSLRCAAWPVAPEGRGWRGTDPWPPVHRREVGPRRRPLRLFFIPLALVTEQPGLRTLGILQDWWVTSWGSTWPRCLFCCKTTALFLDRRCVFHSRARL